MSKYNSRHVTIDNITFDSIRESQRYGELKLMEKAGEIRSLEIHPVLVLQRAFVYRGKKIGAITYEADFRYFSNIYGVFVYEDLKGYETQAFRLKWKMLLHKFRNSLIEFRIVR